MSEVIDAQSRRARVLPARKPGEWIIAGVLIVVCAIVVIEFIATPNIMWSAVGQYLFDGRILEGLGLTIILTIVCMAVGIVLGVLIATMRMSNNPVISSIAWSYVLFFRGTPLLVQIIFWFNLALVFPAMFGMPTNALITPFVAAVLGLGLNEAAYMAEIFRGGIEAIDKGQNEAGAATGLGRGQVLRNIILPQAIKICLPATGNQVIVMLKNTSLVSVIATQELLTNAQLIYSTNFLTVELLIVASIWYLLVTTLATLAQRQLERALSPQRRGRGVPLRNVAE